MMFKYTATKKSTFVRYTILGVLIVQFAACHDSISNLITTSQAVSSKDLTNNGKAFAQTQPSPPADLDPQFFSQLENQRDDLLDIFSLSLEKIAPHLSSWRYTSQHNIRLQCASQKYETVQKNLIECDKQGRCHHDLLSPEHHLELFSVGENIYVRYDRGYLREKNRRDMDAAALMQQSLDLFIDCLAISDGIRLEKAEATLWENRPAQRFTLHTGDSALHTHHRNHKFYLPEGMKTTQLSGSILIDHQSGILLKGDVEMILQIDAPQRESTQITWQCQSSLHHFEQIRAIKIPKTVAEFNRRKQWRNPLSFWIKPSVSEKTDVLEDQEASTAQ